MRITTTSQKFFEDKYRALIDPWNFEKSAYERQRYNSLLRELGTRRWKRAFEPGCSIGILTKRLARRCDHPQAIDISPTATSRAKKRCRNLQNVAIRCGSLSEAIPDGDFDLIVFSEIGYYFEPEDLQQILTALVAKLLPGGTLVAGHWLGTS